MSQNEVVVRAKIAVDATELKALREETARWGGGAGGGQGGTGGGPNPSSGSGGPPGAPPVPGSRDDDAPTVITHLPPPPTPGGGGSAAPSMGGAGGMAASAGAMNLLIQSAQIIVQNGQIAMQGGGPPPPGGAPGNGGGGDGDGGGSRDPRRPPPPPNQGSGIPGAGFISNTASTATGIALGSTILGFLTGSAERWQETDKALGALDRRFDALDRKAGNFAASMGVVRAEAAALLETLGAQTNTVDLGQARMGVGFARTTGTDPAAAMRFLGTGSRMTGSALGTTDMLRILGQAKMTGQGDGRLPEFMDSVLSLMQSEFQATGQVGRQSNTMLTSQALMSVPSMIFGPNDPRGVGMGAVSTLNSMQGMFSGSTSPGMGVELLRAMRYGRPGGPGYLEAMERKDAGVYNTQNLLDLFSYWRGKGLSGETIARMGLGDARKSGMNVNTWRSIANYGASDEGFAALQEALKSGDITNFLEGAGTSSLSEKEQALFSTTGFAGTGSGATVLSQHRQRQMDDMTAATGPQMLQSVMDFTAIAGNLGTAVNEIIKAFSGGDGFLDIVNRATGDLRQLSEGAAKAARILNSGDIASFEEGDAGRFAAEVMNTLTSQPSAPREVGARPVGAMGSK